MSTHNMFMENWRKLTQNYLQMPFLDNSSEVLKIFNKFCIFFFFFFFFFLTVLGTLKKKQTKKQQNYEYHNNPKYWDK